MIQLRHASVEVHEHGCTSFFVDDTRVEAVPHPWDHHYSVIAHRCGYGDDLHRYCVEHEVAHHVVCETLLGEASPVLWGIAHGEPLPPEKAAFEEMMAQGLQRYARAAEEPIIGGIDWQAMRNRFLQVLR